MIIRILAETGIVGAVFFILWHFELFRTGWWCFQNSTSEQDRNLSFALLLVATSQVIEYYAMSSFHVHYLFFVFGLLPAWQNVLRSEKRLATKPQTVMGTTTIMGGTLPAQSRLGLRGR